MIEISIWWIPFLGILFFFFLDKLTEDTPINDGVQIVAGGWLLISLILYTIKGVIWLCNNVRIVV